MLQYSTIEPRTLELLKELMRIPQLNDFFLAGGTALSLYYGHRKSIDLDLFSIVDFEPEKLIPVLESRFAGFTYTQNPIGIFAFIDDIKVDFVRYHYFKQIDDPFIENGTRLFGIKDIMAMKIAAIMKRGVKKDFWDIAELLQHYSIEESINCYYRKFPNHQLLISIPNALTYFDDAEQSIEPISLKDQTWKEVKKSIQQKVNDYLK